MLSIGNFHTRPRLSKEYLDHQVFQELKDISTCYECLSDAAIGFMPYGYDNRLWENPDVYIASSIGGTIDSIGLLLKEGRVNDSFALLRKYYDEVLFDIYQSVKREDFDHNDLKNIPYIDEELQRWREGLIRVPKVDKLIKYLKKAQVTKVLMGFFNFDEGGGYDTMRQDLDNNMHMCSYLHLLKNENQIHNEYRVKYLDRINVYAKKLFVLHLSAIFIVNSHYMMASDFRDCMEVGIEPPKGSENWIATWAQDAFDNYIKPWKELAEYVKAACCLDVEL